MQTKEAKRAAAEVRQAAADKLSPAQRLQRLDEMFGPGLGAAKERAKLEKRAAARVAVQEQPLFVEPAEPGQPPKRAKQKRQERETKRGA